MPDDLYFRRQGFWLRMARERSGKSQKGAALHLGLSGTSKSTISDYENGVTRAPQESLLKLARWYIVPLSLFTDPVRTSDEVIDRLIDEATRSASDAERQDWELEQEQGPEDDAGLNGARGKRSA